MKVLHIAGKVSTGGIGTVIRSLMALNPESKHVHDALSLQEKGVPGLKDGTVYAAHKTPAIFNRLVHEYDAFCVHSPAPKLILALRKSKKPICLFQHGMGVSRGSVLKRRMKQLWYSKLPAVLDAKVVASTHFAFQKLEHTGVHIDPSRRVVIPFGIVLEQFQGQSVPREKAFITLGTASTFAPIKRMDWILKSLKHYKGKQPLMLLIAGSGPLEGELKKLASEIDQDTITIQWLGEVKDIAAFYRQLDLFVFASHNESFGLVVLEALASKVPVVAFADLGGASELLEEEQNSIVLPPSVESMAAFWERLDQEPELVTSLKNGISTKALAPYHIRHTRQALDELLLDEMKEKS